MAEYFDIVDSQDNVIGKDTRERIHKYGKLHRAIHVMIYNKDGEYFLQKRSATKDVSPLCWGSSVSGHVDSGEDYETAMRREIGEEVGIKAPEKIDFLFKTNARDETGKEFVRVYDFQYDGKFKLNENEICDGCWKSISQINEWIRNSPESFTRSFRYIWSIYCMEKERN
jgi:isopentenyl-diphosphate delta-isomerase type 1